jgi:hypothetical protein
VAILEAQLEQMRTTDERLLQFMQLALGALLTFGIVLITFSWFSTGRSYEQNRDALEKDKAAIQLELEGVIGRSLNTLQAEINRNLQDQRSEMANNRNSLEEHLRSVIASEFGSLRIATSQAEADMRKEIKNTSAEFQTQFDKLREQGSAHSKAIRRLQIDLEFQVADSERRYWESKGVWNNVLPRSLTQLGIVLETSQEWRVPYILDNIIEALRNASPPLANDYSVQLANLLSNLPTGNELKRERILEIMRDRSQ